MKMILSFNSEQEKNIFFYFMLYSSLFILTFLIIHFISFHLMSFKFISLHFISFYFISFYFTMFISNDKNNILKAALIFILWTNMTLFQDPVNKRWNLECWTFSSHCVKWSHAPKLRFFLTISLHFIFFTSL